MAKRFQAEYTAAEILELYRARSTEKDEARVRDLATTFRALCRMEHAVNIPAQYKAITKDVRTPFVRDTHHRVTSSLVAKSPVAHITPKDEKREEYRTAAAIAERFDMAMLERFNKETGRDLVFNLTAALVRDGSSVLKTVHRPDAWANFPEGVSSEDQDTWKRGVDLPIAWTEVDRLCTVFEGGQYGDEWLIEYGEYTKPYLRNRYKMTEKNGRLINPKTYLEGRPYPEGMLAASEGQAVKMEFWTPREWHVLIDGDEAPGFPKANPYAPHLPYFRADAYESESLLYSLLFLVPRLDELLTMKLNWAYLGAYPNPVLETVPNSASMPGLDGPLGDGAVTGQNPLVWTPGKLMDLPLGRTLRFLSPPSVGQDINELITLMKGMIDVAGIPSVMRGVSMSGDSGYKANQLRAAAEMAYKLAATAGQRQLEKALDFTHWLVAHRVQQTVYVLGWDSLNKTTGKPKRDSSSAWLGLSPDKQGVSVADISKLGPVTVKYRPTLPTDEQANAMVAVQMTNAPIPLYDVRHALENFLQEEDPDAIIEALALQKALASPEMQALIQKRAMQNAGLLPKEEPASPPAIPLGQGDPMLLPQGLNNLGPTEVIPGANQPLPGVGGIPGLTMPMQPTPQDQGGVPGMPGGRPAGFFPGQPGNQGPGG